MSEPIWWKFAKGRRGGGGGGGKKCYAVREGKQRGIFWSWTECSQSVTGFPGSEFKGFGSVDEAKTYLTQPSKRGNAFTWDEVERLASGVRDPGGAGAAGRRRDRGDRGRSARGSPRGGGTRGGGGGAGSQRYFGDLPDPGDCDLFDDGMRVDKPAGGDDGDDPAASPLPFFISRTPSEVDPQLRPTAPTPPVPPPLCNPSLDEVIVLDSDEEPDSANHVQSQETMCFSSGTATDAGRVDVTQDDPVAACLDFVRIDDAGAKNDAPAAAQAPPVAPVKVFEDWEKRRVLEVQLRQDRLFQSRVFMDRYGIGSFHTESKPEESSSNNTVPKDETLSDEQQRLIDLALAGISCFVTGSGGTGKSFTVKTLVARLRNAGRRTVILAPTGIAAMHVGGRTIHSYASLGTCQTVEMAVANSVTRNRDRWEEIDVVIIDEISMVSADLFEKVEAIAREVREVNKPFGGLQVIVCGDFFQLPPVPSKQQCPHCSSFKVEIDKLDKSRATCLKPDCRKVFDPRTLFAFQSPKWREVGFKFVELTKIFRQDDFEFVSALNRIRCGVYLEQDRTMLNQCKRLLDESKIVATRLFSHKKDASDRNEKMFNDLQAQVVHEFRAVDWASNEKTQKLLIHISDYIQAPELIRLKVGTQVLLIANLEIKNGLVNGSRGVVVDFDFAKDEHGNAKSSTKYPVVVFEQGKVRTIDEFNFEAQLSPSKIIARRQVPLVHGWAITIHKSQGLSLDKVSLDLRRVFSPGQAYVALSRVRSLQGLHLVADGGSDGLPKSSVMVDPNVLRFYDECRRTTIAKHEWEESALPVVRAHFQQVGCNIHNAAEEFGKQMTELYLRWLLANGISRGSEGCGDTTVRDAVIELEGPQ